MTASTRSADGTELGFDRTGSGPPIILIAGAFGDRATTRPLSAALATQFTVFNMDRRGRGDSGDTAPYSVQREIEDLAAMVDEAGGRASLFGHTSGASLAVRAAADGLAITHLVLYEPPFNPDDSYPLLCADLPVRLGELVSAGRRGDAVELYQTEAVGLPDQVVTGMRSAPFRPALESIAHTLAYDAMVVGDRSLPTALAGITVPALVICGENTAPFMSAAARAVAGTLPQGRLSTLSGPNHGIDAAATAAAITRFLAH